MPRGSNGHPERLRKEGIQHFTDFEAMSNAFACTSANCRAEVLEELINETDRVMFFFFETVLNSTVRYDPTAGISFATPPCGNFMGSSEGPIFFFAAYAWVESSDGGAGRGSSTAAAGGVHNHPWEEASGKPPASPLAGSGMSGRVADPAPNTHGNTWIRGILIRSVFCGETACSEWGQIKLYNSWKSNFLLMHAPLTQQRMRMQRRTKRQ